MSDRLRPTVASVPAQGARGLYFPKRIDGKWFFVLKTVTPDSRREKFYPVGRCRTCEGHETADQARAHFREFLLADQLRLSLPRGDGQHWVLCAWCVREKRLGLAFALRIALHEPRVAGWLSARSGLITNRYALIAGGFYAFALCPRHQTREIVGKLMPQEIGDFAG